jgi:hypothetical protein
MRQYSGRSPVVNDNREAFFGSRRLEELVRLVDLMIGAYAQEQTFGL